MKTVEDIENEIWDMIEIATKERNANKIQQLNSIATKVASIKEELKKIEGFIRSDLKNTCEQSYNYNKGLTGLQIVPV